VSVQYIRPAAVVSRIWEIYRERAAVLVGAALCLFAIQLVVLAALPGASIAAAILFWVLDVLYQGVVVKLVQALETGQPPAAVPDLLRGVEPVLLRLLAVSVLSGIGITIGFVLVIVPGLWLMTIWAVVAPVTVLERPGVFAAFGRSRELVRGNGWGVFGVLVIVYSDLFALVGQP
jgi:hypothetical protein